MTPHVVAVVLNWNGLRDTLDCLESLAASDWPRLTTVVVDNASDEDVAGPLAQRFPEVTLVRNPANLGFAGGMNAGLRRALELEAGHALLLNNDTLVDPGMVSALVEASLAHPEAGILSPLVLDRADPGVLVSAGMRCDLRHAWQGPPLGRGEPDRGQFDGVHDVDAVSGAAMLVPLEAVRAVGMLDEDLFLYCEDVDWGMRMRTAGRRVCVVGEARLWHGVATASGGEISPNALYYTTRNTYVIADRHVPMRGLRRRARHAEITLANLAHALRAPRPRAAARAVLAGRRDFRAGRLGARAG